MALHRSQARSWTYAAQGAGLLGLAALALVIITPRAEVEAPVILIEAPSAPAAGPDPAAAQPVALNDWTILAASLNETREPMPTVAAVDPGQSEETPDEGAVAGATQEPRPNPAPPGWQYVGFARVRDRVSALVMINESQRFVREGADLEGFKIADITTDRLLLERDGRRFEVKRAEPAPFDPNISTADARARAERARGRTARAEQDQMRLLEEQRRQRMIEQAQQEFEDPTPGGPQ